MRSKNTGKKKSLKLDVSPDLNFTLIGISSHENDYRLVWAINNRLKFRFMRTENLVLKPIREARDLAFGRFLYIDEERMLTFYLLSNRCPDGFLFPEIKNMDFLVQVIGEMDRAGFDDLLRSLKNIEIISGAYPIDPLSLRGINRIVPA